MLTFISLHERKSKIKQGEKQVRVKQKEKKKKTALRK